MNKKILGIFVSLLVVAMLATPLIAGAGKSKAMITLVFYDFQVTSIETKECGRFTVATVQGNAKILVLSSVVGQGMLPAVGGIVETQQIKKFDPETGFGTIKSRSTLDFGDFGSFKVYSSGKCAGILPLPGGPLYAWYFVQEACGFGRGALRGTSLKLAQGYQASLPSMGGLPSEFVGTSGVLSIGEIIY